MRNSEEGLRGRVAVVTGGASGIGLAISEAFSETGARVAIFDLDEEAGRRVASGLDGARAFQVDVSDSASVCAARDAVESDLGPIESWVNNAGISDPELARRVAAAGSVQGAGPGAIPTSSLRLVDDEMWSRMLRVHLDGTFFGTRAAAEVMAPRGRGTITNMASICGLVGCATAPHYSAAKGGILAFTKAVAKELAASGVRVNAIAPGHVETPLLTLGEAARRRLEEDTPAGRLGLPEEVAAAAVFLASERAGYFVGATLTPTGGLVTV
ncbi:MAG: SDR family oxidoreductase [Actinobacteria bacterium]|nr:SDR family oxidoreductase [Actinomycetota bacterium]